MKDLPSLPEYGYGRYSGNHDHIQEYTGAAKLSDHGLIKTLQRGGSVGPLSGLVGIEDSARTPWIVPKMSLQSELSVSTASLASEDQNLRQG